MRADINRLHPLSAHASVDNGFRACGCGYFVYFIYVIFNKFIKTMLFWCLIPKCRRFGLSICYVYICLVGCITFLYNTLAKM
jgi:hypothetical protein